MSFNLSLFNAHSHSRRSAFNQAALTCPGKGRKGSKEEPRHSYIAFTISTAEFKLLYCLPWQGRAPEPAGGAARRQSRAGPRPGCAGPAGAGAAAQADRGAREAAGAEAGQHCPGPGRDGGREGCRHPSPLAEAPGPRELRPAGATHPRSAAMQLPARHLLPARTGPSPALPPTTGRVSLCSRRRHFPAAASVPAAVRSLHSPGPGTASPSLPCPCATAGATQTERRPRPSRPYQRGPPSARGATPLREFRPAQSARSTSPHAMRGSRRLAAAAG